MAAKYSEILVIGSGPSGLMASILASERYQVTLVERDGKQFQLGKRILVSGNGRANFFNANLLNAETYDKKEFASVKDIVLSHGRNYAQETLSFLTQDLGFAYREEGALYYPFFNRSECLENLLAEEVKRRNISLVKGEFLSVDPKEKKVTLIENGQRTQIGYGKLFLALGGMSYDRKVNPLTLLESLSLKKVEFSPCLCPVKVKEKVPAMLNKNRLKGTLTLKADDTVLYQEQGEILFKEDGISGICVFDSTLYLQEAIHQKKYSRFTYEFDYMEGVNQRKVALSSYPLFLRQFYQTSKQKPGSKLVFTFDSFYPFVQSQISYGGIALEEVDPHTMLLKKYPEIAISGELLSQAFICGGYNMGMALIEGYKFGKEVTL